VHDELWGANRKRRARSGRIKTIYSGAWQVSVRAHRLRCSPSCPRAGQPRPQEDLAAPLGVVASPNIRLGDPARNAYRLGWAFWGEVDTVGGHPLCHSP
jgi:hypothetical protein